MQMPGTVGAWCDRIENLTCAIANFEQPCRNDARAYADRMRQLDAESNPEANIERRNAEIERDRNRNLALQMIDGVRGEADPKGAAEGSNLRRRLEDADGLIEQYRRVVEDWLLSVLAPKPTEHNQWSTAYRAASDRLVRAVKELKRTDGNERLKPRPERHPAEVLFHALNGLHTVCSNWSLFRDLDQRREGTRSRHMNLLNFAGKIASDRANALAKEGAPFEQQFAALAGVTGEVAEQSEYNEPPDFTKSLRENTLLPGVELCKQAKAALRAGAAKVWDAAIQPNSVGQSRSIELHTQLQDAERLFLGLEIGLCDPRVSIGSIAKRMGELDGYFARLRDELGGVLEMRGLDVPVVNTPAAPKIDPAIMQRLEAVELAQNSTHNPTTSVVLWPGAEPSTRNIKLARTRTAYLEAHGNVQRALQALKSDGFAIAQSTFYDHLAALDTACRGWRSHLMVSDQSGNLENGVHTRTVGKSRGKSR